MSQVARNLSEVANHKVVAESTNAAPHPMQDAERWKS
jgi:hypothetical protein